MEGFDLLPALLGGLTGALVGAVYERRRRRRAAVAPLPDAGARSLEERRREVAPFVARASRAVAAYSHMIDAGNLDDLAALRDLFERLRAAEAAEGAADRRPADRRLAAAVDAFAALHDEIERKVAQRVGAGQAAAAAGELRLRGPSLSGALDELNAAAERYVLSGS